MEGHYHGYDEWERAYGDNIMGKTSYQELEKWFWQLCSAFADLIGGCLLLMVVFLVYVCVPALVVLSVLALWKYIIL